LRSGAADCRICRARSALERSALAPLRRAAPGVQFRFVPERGASQAPRNLRASQARRNLRASRALTTLEGARDFAFTQRRPARRTSPVSSSLRLLFVGGKGGVGKTTAAAAMAIDAASRNHGRRVLLLSTDPAHSLGDVLGIQLGDTPRAVPGLAGMLEAREIDADAALARQREALRAAVEQMFEGYARTGGEAGRSGVGVDLSHDRAAAASLLDLSPPGLDEIVALLSVVDALQPLAAANRGTTLPPSRNASADRRSLVRLRAERYGGTSTKLEERSRGGGGQGRRSEGYDLVVVDTAPTGHALKLLAMPELAERWAAALMRLLLKYRDVARVGPLAEPLVELSKGAKRLQALLHDGRAAQVVAVTRPAALPRMETMRLMDALRRLRIAVPTVVVNAVTPSARRSADARCARCRAARALERSEIAALARPLRCDIIFAPLVLPPPRGPARLTRWMRQWQKWNRSRDMPRTSTPS
jgi:arsenite-transporting ATPase